MPSTLSLSCSRKIYELLAGACQTERFWVVKFKDPFKPTHLATSNDVIPADSYSIPAPSFSETIRLLPKIAEKKGWEDYECSLFLYDVYPLYVSTPTEEEGMAKVSEYLEGLI